MSPATGPRKHVSRGGIAGLLSITIFTFGLHTLYAPAGPASAQRWPTPTPIPSQCAVDSLTTVEPDTLLLGESVSVTHAFRFLCIPPKRDPNRIVVVVDPSSGMRQQDIKSLQDAIGDLARFLNEIEEGGSDVDAALIEVLDRPRTRLRLGLGVDRLRSATSRIAAAGETDLESGIKAGHKHILEARVSAPIFGRRGETLVLFSDGKDAKGCGAAMRARGRAMFDGILMVSVCVGADCDQSCSRRIASSPRYAYDLKSFHRSFHIFDRMLRLESINYTLRSIEVIDQVSTNTLYVRDSADPKPSQFVTATQTIIWQSNWVPKDGVTFTYKVRPQRAGRQKINTGVNVSWKDNFQLIGSKRNAAVEVMVLEPNPIWPEAGQDEVASPMVRAPRTDLR